MHQKRYQTTEGLKQLTVEDADPIDADFEVSVIDGDLTAGIMGGNAN